MSSVPLGHIGASLETDGKGRLLLDGEAEVVDDVGKVEHEDESGLNCGQCYVWLNKD